MNRTAITYAESSDQFDSLNLESYGPNRVENVGIAYRNALLRLEWAIRNAGAGIRDGFRGNPKEEIHLTARDLAHTEGFYKVLEQELSVAEEIFTGKVKG